MVDGALALAGVRIYERAARTTATVEAHDSNACTELPIRHHAVYPRRAPANASPTALRANASSPRPHPFASRGWLVGSGWLRGAGAYLSPPLALHPARVSRAVLPGLALATRLSTERSMALSSTSRSRVLVALSAMLTVAAHTELNASRTSGADRLVAW
jgi:hypothetical protein